MASLSRLSKAACCSLVLVLAGLGAARADNAGADDAGANDPGGPIKIGLLDDMSGPLSLETGKGDELGARMAIEEVGSKVLGRDVVLLTADHQNKADVGLSIARQWVDRDGVRVITGLDNSAIALAVHHLTRDHPFISLVAGAGSSDLSGKACVPLGFHWTHDSFSHANSLVAEAVADRWFFITADYAFGLAQQRDMTELITRRGGTVLGSVRFPQGNTDFSSFVLQAQASGADNVVLATSANDLANLVKGLGEFGMLAGKQHFYAPILSPSVIASTGLDAAHGLITDLSFFPALNAETMAFSKRFALRYDGQTPGATNEGVYSAVRDYLKAVAAAGTIDPEKVAAKMHQLPVDDIVNHGAQIRADGRLMNDHYVVSVKPAAESQFPGDFFKLLKVVPADQAYRPLAGGGCPMVR